MLARIRKAREEGEGGFTLIELLVVIIIIGILAAIAIPVFLNQRKKGYEASEKSDLRSVANEMESYFTDQQIYPSKATTPATFVFTAASGTSPAKVSIGSTPTDVRLSKNNTADLLQTGSKGFCLSMVNSGVSGVTWYYDSINGGLNNTGCSAPASYT